MNLCIDFNVDSPTSDLITKTYNNVPEVTLLISKYHLLSVIYYNYIGTSYHLTSLPTLSSTVTTSSFLSFVSSSTSFSLPTLSSTVTVVLSSSPSIHGDDSPVIIPIIAGVVCFVIVLLTITLIIITIMFVHQRRQKRKMNVSSSKDGIELTMTNQLYSQHKPPERTLINPLYTGNCYYYYIYSVNNGLEVSMSVLYLLYKPPTTLNY